MAIDVAVRLGSRLKAARDKAGLTQEDLAARMGLDHRQTLAAIEAGERRLAADELLRAINVLGVDLEYFTDSLRLVGDEGRFSFRSNRLVPPALLDEFEERAGRWIALYRELELEQSGPSDWLEQKLALTERSSFEDAQAAGEAIVKKWQLGSRPAERLSRAIEVNLNALVLNVVAPREISGAASQVPGLSVVLVNRDEPEGRRMFDIAHELFHILTWDAMAPKRVESNELPTGKGKRIEQLAENFAAALLMPSAGLKALWEQRDPDGDIHEWLNRTATEFRVSAAACKWRAANLGMLSRTQLRAIDDRRLVANGRIGKEQCAIPLFSEPFVRRVGVALDNGRLSAKRAASLLHLSMAELGNLLQGYGIEPQFEAAGAPPAVRPDSPRIADPMLPADRRVLRALAARIREWVPQARIWAFGSRARGDAEPDSDFDVCIVLPEVTRELRARIQECAWEVAFDHGLVIPTVVLTDEAFENGPMSASTLVANIRREGVAA